VTQDIESLQKRHYDQIAVEYSLHYGDKWSQAYRRKYINDRMLDGLDLRGANVLEAMCGDGVTTAYLREKGAQVTGLDISEAEMAHFRERWPDCKAVCASVLETGLPDESFDCVIVVGGLHHVHPHVSEAINEIHRLLRPGGYFCFTEPHTGSFIDVLRKLWYRHDKYFAENEEAIDLRWLHQQFSEKFLVAKEEYLGNIAYLFVLNSLILRVPPLLKEIISRPLLWIEAVITPLQRRATSCFSLSQWQKKDGSAK
jgi:SAM-dependent methyltransferase